MASLDWSQCPAVESIAGKLNGALGAAWNAHAGDGDLREYRSRGQYQ
jgi:hypothetical protein